MKIALILLLWTIASIAYLISRIGYKEETQGIRKYFEYVICPPALAIAWLVGTIGFLIRKPYPPVVVIGNNRVEGRRLYPDKEFSRQVRVRGEKGTSWTINIYSNSEMEIDIPEVRYLNEE